MTSRWARRFVLTAGRTGGWFELATHTLVSAPRFDLRVPMLPEARALWQRAAAGPESIAELSANTGIPLGPTRVLVSDLIQAGRVVIAPPTYRPLDRDVLEKLLDGLHNL
jgi:Protein of unknown function (DUF742)